jgi:hypothetical protein
MIALCELDHLIPLLKDESNVDHNLAHLLARLGLLILLGHKSICRHGHFRGVVRRGLDRGLFVQTVGVSVNMYGRDGDDRLTCR